MEFFQNITLLLNGENRIYFWILLLFIMLFAHIRDDFCKQGIMADMKQKGWWTSKIDEIFTLTKENEEAKKKYKFDYVVALIVHSFSWTMSVTLPALIYILLTKQNELQSYLCIYTISVVCHTVIHAFIDNEKANRFTINLVVDQLLHFTQIVLIWLLCL